MTILLFSGGYYRCLGEIRYWAVARNADGRSDLGLDNFQHREHTDAGQSPGASLWSQLCMWSRVISRKAVQTDLSPCLSVRWPVYLMLCIPSVGFLHNSHQLPSHIVHLKQEELNGTWSKSDLAEIPASRSVKYLLHWIMNLERSDINSELDGSRTLTARFVVIHFTELPWP